MKLLIIDRDHTERTGIKWFITHYQLEITTVFEVGTIEEAVNCIELESPEIILLELELLAYDSKNALKTMLAIHPHQLITMTAEPLFKNALEALSLRSLTLLVKPLDLNLLKHYLTHASRQDFQTEQGHLSLTKQYSIYPAIFLEDSFAEHEEFTYCMLFETEFAKHNEQLFHWLQSLQLSNHFTFYPLSKRIIVFSNDGTIEECTKKAKSLIREWNNSNDAHLNIAIYDLPNQSIKTMYTALKQALNLRFQSGFSQVFYVSQLPIYEKFNHFLTIEQQRLWINSLEQNDAQAVKQFLYNISNMNTFYQPDAIRIHLTSILAQVRRFMLKYQMDKMIDVEQKYDLLFDITLNHPMLYTIIQEFVLFCQEVMNQAVQQKEQGQFDYVNGALDYIDIYYTDSKLTLDTLANFLGISGSYLSMLFSTTKGVTFKQYLNEKRLSHAGDLLRETGLSVNEISAASGFNDPNYFSKVFKAKYERSPLAFRRQEKLEGD
ncbi:helix-turn-helix transcriptional regulator [Viridibacillus sp. YIM B01967]|uniref:Helix-turn-helix transcriptional regulator n=1 Tax=Viridibacillus soli TaxID=2798301 RepID=A0ABS1HAM3_9BACL|nr:helix-turn-helix transcriptional regulator [Viridibacillus soli]MBK3496486.1 helix-turn-helix transcriptional regulator [Viridibacillus soli]